MHTIRYRTPSVWCVMVHTDYLDRAVCELPSPFEAAIVASWLNGGKLPDTTIIQHIDWYES